MKLNEIYPHIVNHEYVRRKDWEFNNVIKLSDDNECFEIFKAYRDDVYLPACSLHSYFPICEDEDYVNKLYDLSIPEILADDWEVFDK